MEAPGAALSGAWHPWEDRAEEDQVVRTKELDPAQLAVENERLQRVLRARLEEEHALRRVATCVAQGHAPAAVLTLVTEEVVRHLSADTAVTVRYDAPDRATIVAKWTAPHITPSPLFEVGEQIELAPETALARVYETRAPARSGSYDAMSGRFARDLRERGIRGSAAAPILVEGHLRGVLAGHLWPAGDGVAWIPPRTSPSSSPAAAPRSRRSRSAFPCTALAA